MLSSVAKKSDQFAQEQLDQHNLAVFQEIQDQINVIRNQVSMILRREQNSSLQKKWISSGAFSPITGAINLSKVSSAMVEKKLRIELNQIINKLQSLILKALGRVIRINNVQVEKRNGELIVVVYEADHDEIEAQQFGNFIMTRYKNLMQNLNENESGTGPKKPKLDSTYLSVLDQHATMKRRNAPYVAWKVGDTWTKIKIEEKSALAEFYIFHFYKTPDEIFGGGYPSNFSAFFFGSQTLQEKLVQQVDNQSGFFEEDVSLGKDDSGLEQYIGVKFGKNYGMYSIVSVLRYLDELEAGILKGNPMSALLAYKKRVEISQDNLQSKISIVNDEIPEIGKKALEKWKPKTNITINI